MTFESFVTLNEAAKAIQRIQILKTDDFKPLLTVSLDYWLQNRSTTLLNFQVNSKKIAVFIFSGQQAKA